jgi:hypothetical protein
VNKVVKKLNIQTLEEKALMLSVRNDINPFLLFFEKKQSKKKFE